MQLVFRQQMHMHIVLFITILVVSVMYVIQFSLGVLQMLVQEM